MNFFEGRKEKEIEGERAEFKRRKRKKERKKEGKKERKIGRKKKRRRDDFLECSSPRVQ